MKTYRYSGPASGVTLSDGTEILLWPGKNVSLPEEHAEPEQCSAAGWPNNGTG